MIFLPKLPPSFKKKKKSNHSLSSLFLLTSLDVVNSLKIYIYQTVLLFALLMSSVYH